MTVRTLLPILATFSLTVVACSGNVSGSAPDGADSGTAGDGGCSGGTVAAMVAMPQGYSIDATEVTRCQYQAWLDTNPSAGDQDPWCAWNTDYTPTGTDCGFPLVKGGDLPVGCVNWCDAYAYCKDVGKRLCGKIGGGPNAMDDYLDPSKSQWYNVCSSGGEHYYTYGDDYDYGSKCNDADRKPVGLTAVGSLAQCQSPEPGYGGVYDLTGNVWEFEDSCDGTAGRQDSCEMRGGSLASPDVYSYCGEEALAYRDQSGTNIGFRCCSQ